MKKLLILTLTLLICLALPYMTAMAAEAVTAESGADGMAVTLPDTFFDWASIGTIPGAIAAVVFLVQVLKLPLDKVWKIPTQIIVFVLSIGVLLLAQAFVPSLGGFTLQNAILCFINGSIVALSAMSAYELLIKRVESQKYQQLPVAELAVSTPLLTQEDIPKVAAELAAAIKSQTSSTGA